MAITTTTPPTIRMFRYFASQPEGSRVGAARLERRAAERLVAAGVSGGLGVEPEPVGLEG
jgi:hypothetical protein